VALTVIAIGSPADIAQCQAQTMGAASQSAIGSGNSAVPEDKPAENSGSASESLSRKLDRSNGVITPPRHVDPGLTQAPPPAGPQSTPVIPPPGGPNGPPNVTAK
jgi:hypothetical protein